MITIYLDMDGVVADFHKAYDVYDPERSDRKKFRSAVLEGKIFETLDPMPNARELLDFVASWSHLAKIEMLTSMGTFDEVQGDSAKRQKLYWLNKHRIPYHANFVRCKEEKAQYATPTSILIDDSIGCILPFRDAGGIGIHHNDSVHKETLLELGNHIYLLANRFSV
jgi:hypothetical protein